MILTVFIARLISISFKNISVKSSLLYTFKCFAGNTTATFFQLTKEQIILPETLSAKRLK